MENKWGKRERKRERTLLGEEGSGADERGKRKCRVHKIITGMLLCLGTSSTNAVLRQVKAISHLMSYD